MKLDLTEQEARQILMHRQMNLPGYRRRTWSFAVFYVITGILVAFYLAENFSLIAAVAGVVILTIFFVALNTVWMRKAQRIVDQQIGEIND